MFDLLMKLDDKEFSYEFPLGSLPVFKTCLPRFQYAN